MVSQRGILTHRARADGSPYVVISRAAGTYTALPEVGVEVGCGGVLYRVDDRPVLLLCGAVPAYRDLAIGDDGEDVRQLNRNLHQLGYDAKAGVGFAPDDSYFTGDTAKALQALQHDKGVGATGKLALADAAFLPEPVRIAKVTGELGGPSQPGAAVAEATSDALEVHLDLDPSEQGVLKAGDLAQITLPGNTPASGKVARLGSVVAGRAGPNGQPGDPIIPVSVSLDDPAKARGLEEVPVQVDITTTGVDDALSVPVTALVGRSGGGFAVEVVRPGGGRELVAVRVGLFDTTAGRVEVDGDLREGDDVVVPSL
jgi:multidrug efflux pump subunit AcrA (membrane-fusion protein)